MEKLIIKKKCKACGNVVMCERLKHGVTVAPDSCNTCKSLGVEKAIEERLMCGRKSMKSDIKINDAQKLRAFQSNKKW